VPYPRPKTDFAQPDYEGIPTLVDLVLSPLPFYYWCCALRINILLHNKPGALAAASRHLGDLEIALLSTEASRCAHRYTDWSLVVGFPDLAERFKADPLSFNAAEFRRCIADKIKVLEQELVPDKSSVFSQEGDFEVELETPIRTRPIGELAYFYDYANRTLAENDVKPFELTARDNNYCLTSEDFELQMNRATDAFGFSRIPLPCNGFAETQFETCMMRIAALPSSTSQRMVIARFGYNSIGSVDLRHEVIQEVSQELGQDWLIWRLLTTTSRSKADSRSGTIQMILSRATDGGRDIGDYHSNLIQIVSRASARLKERSQGISLKLTDVTPLADPGRAISHLARSQPHDVFISYATNDKKAISPYLDELAFSDLSYYLDYEKVNTGQDVSPQVKQGMRHCKEMILFASPAALESNWISAEIGMAAQLDLRVTVVELPGLGPKRRKKLMGLFDNSNTSWYSAKQFTLVVDSIKQRIQDWTQAQ